MVSFASHSLRSVTDKVNFKVISAVRSASDYAHAAIQAAFPLGKGNGPLNHLHSIGMKLLPVSVLCPFADHNCAVSYSYFLGRLKLIPTLLPVFSSDQTLLYGRNMSNTLS